VILSLDLGRDRLQISAYGVRRNAGFDARKSSKQVCAAGCGRKSCETSAASICSGGPACRVSLKFCEKMR
jgi:hypothetical protein